MKICIFGGMNDPHQTFIRETLQMAANNAGKGLGGPFGALVVLNGRVIGRGVNKVTQINDPTAHAEIVAIREACKNAGSFKLENAVIYSSCEPCPMCLSAIYWARISRIYYAAVNTDAAKAGFDDSYIYRQIPLPPEKRDIPAIRVADPNHFMPFQTWLDSEAKIDY